MKCIICGGEVSEQFSHQILRKYSCTYYYCAFCGFLQTEEPYWLDEAYSSAIASCDTGLVQRNIVLSKQLSALLFMLFDSSEKYLDIAGGYGMLTRLMRDVGFDYYWSDKYCENILAKGFERQENVKYSAVSAFEVIEHVWDPVNFIKESLEMAGCRTMIFSTELFNESPPSPDEWWYYAFETGQHISFYQNRTLSFIATKLGLNYYSNGLIHCLTDKKLNPIIFRILTKYSISQLVSKFARRRLGSKIWKDNLTMIEKCQ